MLARVLNRRGLAGLLALGIAGALMLPARGDSPSLGDLLDQARRAADDHKPAAALHSVKAAYEKLWADTPFFISQALFTRAGAQGFGHYDPRPDASFTNTDTFYVYIEPAAFGYQFDGTVYRFGFVVDLAVLDESGKERGGAKNFTNFDYVKRTANKEIELHFIIDPMKLPPGRYLLKLTVHDKVKDQSVAKVLPFTILP
jgi:hypothetical protein